MKTKTFNKFIKSKHTKISLWEKVQLFFKPTYIGHDYSKGKDKSVTLYIKFLNGKIYIIDEKVEGGEK